MSGQYRHATAPAPLSTLSRSSWFICHLFFCVCIFLEKPFYFKGCGWSRKKNVMWSKGDMMWIVQMENLFTEIFGNDFLVYEWDKAKGTLIISPDSLVCFRYNYALWEEAFLSEQPQLKCSVNYQPYAATNSTPLPSVSKPQPPRFALKDVSLIPKEAQKFQFDLEFVERLNMSLWLGRFGQPLPTLST